MYKKKIYKKEDVVFIVDKQAMEKMNLICRINLVSEVNGSGFYNRNYSSITSGDEEQLDILIGGI